MMLIFCSFCMLTICMSLRDRKVRVTGLLTGYVIMFMYPIESVHLFALKL